MSVITTVTAPEQFIIEVNGDYNILFESVTCTVAGALASGTPLKDAATASIAADTVVLGVLADAKPAGTAIVRVMVRGNPTLIDSGKLAVTSATIQAALEAKGIVYAK